MTKIHISAPTGYSGRAIHICPTCRKRRRFVVTAYEYYPTMFECGGCGHVFDSEWWRYRSWKAERVRRIKDVRLRWPKLGSVKSAVKAMCDAIMIEGKPC